MRQPIIGITGVYSSESGLCGNYGVYFRAIAAVGGVPVVIPCMTDLAVVKRQVESLDGIIFSGGPDVDAFNYGKRNHPEMSLMHPMKENWDLALAKEALDHGKQPVLGICLGIQELNVAAGGSLFRHIPEDIGTSVEHRRMKAGVETMHHVRFKEDGPLVKIFGVTELTANSSHHQSVEKPGAGFEAVAWADDGCVEAITPVEGIEKRFVVGLQWHPERIQDQPPQEKIFQAFIQSI